MKLRDDGYRVWDDESLDEHGQGEIVFEYKHSDHPRAAKIVRELLAASSKLGEAESHVRDLEKIIGEGCGFHDKKIAELQSRLAAVQKWADERCVGWSSKECEEIGRILHSGVERQSCNASNYNGDRCILPSGHDGDHCV